MTVSPVAVLKSAVADEIGRRSDALVRLSHRIHGLAELAWEEHESASVVASALREAGFEVVVGAYGVPTAVEATAGAGDFTVVVCAEYDALPGIGHGCGHNVIAAAGVGAAIGLASVAAAANLRVKLLGTPAEEGGGGKAALLEAGAWEGADISLMVHGMTAFNGFEGDAYHARAMRATAVARFQVTFRGRASHAAAAPELAVNAGNAAILSLNAIALLRQHLDAETNLNAYVVEAGRATNVIADLAVIRVEVRAYDLIEWRRAKERVGRCFEGAAVATGCDWEWEPIARPYAPLLHDEVLSDLWDENMTARGRTLGATILPGGSTDMGNVSQVVPTIHPLIAFQGWDASPHNADFAKAAISGEADAALIEGATVLAATVLDAACDAERRAAFQRRTASRSPGETMVPFGL
ncbi:amidohydrolase [Agromyces mediolanus]|uniref:amidohydrolase n=1 Tax=Agromyces mediolanus TaxID=41986 RepID=UPI0020409205|nr:amidohydrolase [Agromyces mediolanus]MCM3656208.1 amidohydrolase [Agromyces mediolanus]